MAKFTKTSRSRGKELKAKKKNDKRIKNNFSFKQIEGLFVLIQNQAECQRRIKKLTLLEQEVSGLIAALVLEQEGYAPHIFEKTDRVGGRVKTETIGEYVFDHGFQVLLESYPMAQKILGLRFVRLTAILARFHHF